MIKRHCSNSKSDKPRFLATLLVLEYLAKLVGGKTFLSTGTSVFLCEPETIYHHGCTVEHPDAEEMNTGTKLQETHGKSCSHNKCKTQSK